MDRNEITALAKGLMPVVRDVVTDATAPLIVRLAELEAQPVPTELAEQLKAATRLLEEPPTVPSIPEAVQPDEVVLRHVAGTVITRGGELAVSYSDGTSERLGAVVGPPGEPGPAGRDGAAGAQGDEGPRGRDGVSIMAAAINRDGELMLTLSDGTVLTPGRVDGRKSK